jgi:amino acid transporter
MPFAMAEDGFLPQQLTRLHPRFGTPAICIVISGIVYALLAIHSLAQLITIYAWLRVATTLMTAVSAARLRKTHGSLERPFKIPGGKAGLIYSVAAPVFMGIVATVGSLLSADKFALHWGPAAILLGPAAYLILRRKAQPAPTN